MVAIYTLVTLGLMSLFDLQDAVCQWYVGLGPVVSTLSCLPDSPTKRIVDIVAIASTFHVSGEPFLVTSSTLQPSLLVTYKVRPHVLSYCVLTSYLMVI
jgi:hypothetical protein